MQFCITVIASSCNFSPQRKSTREPVKNGLTQLKTHNDPRAIPLFETKPAKDKNFLSTKKKVSCFAADKRKLGNCSCF